MNMASLTTIQCPDCNKIFICTIQIKSTIAGGRPILIFPAETCNGCEFDWKSLPVESFDIPLSPNTKNAIIGASR